MDALGELVGDSPPVQAVRKRIARLLERQSDSRRLPPILLQGETGTGKGLLARALHRASQRRAGPFIDVNCAAIPETLLEAEMFGFERGAFTDARQAKAGLFQAATSGSIFLDEVALLSEALQAKLLKVIEERTVRRLGSTRSEPIDVWIITGTNEDLAGAARERRFREDLYHRLAVVTVELPPLRARGDDVILLAEHFLARACADYALAPKTLDASARRVLLAYRWPGNVRELGNVMERVALLTDASEVSAEVLGLPELAPTRTTEIVEPALALDETVEALERGHLAEALAATRWNVSQAALRLGLSRNAVRWRIEKYGLKAGATRAIATRQPAPRQETVAAPSDPPARRALEPAPIPTTVRWERRRVTVLRADLVLPSGEADGVDVVRHLPALLEKVQIFDGRVEDLSPTRLLAAFGLEPVEDAPRRAANAALAMRRAAERSRDTSGESPWSVKIALHVIEGDVGRLGAGALLDRETKVAAWSRLDALIGRADPGEVVVSEAVAPFLERRFDFSRVEGAVTRLGDAERSGLGVGERMARFVGRDRELDLLRSRYEAAASGRGQVVGIVGEAGIGKSRVLYELRHELARYPMTYLEGHCLSYGGGIPYLPVVEVLRAACGIEESDSSEAMVQKALEQSYQVGLEAEATPYLLELLGLKSGRDAMAVLAPEAIKTCTFDALRGLIVKLSQQRPLVLAIEDVHWSDRTSEEFFGTLAETVGGARILLVSSYRPGYHPAWIDKSYATQVALQPLATEDSRHILSSLLGENTTTEPIVTLIVGKADGNPFFLEELARTAQERPDEAWTLTVPATVEEVLLARIDRLPVEDRRLLKSAAVIGKNVPQSLLATITGASNETLVAGLRNLRDAEFLLESRLGSDVEYTFKHALTHDVAYGSMPEDERRRLHAGIVEAIEQRYPDRLTEHVERLAHHAVFGEAWEKAVTYLHQAGGKAASRSANREAITYYEQALEALARLPDTEDRRARAIDIRFDLRSSLLPLGDFDRIFESLREAESLAEVLGDQRRLARLFAYMTNYVSLMGDQARALDYGQRTLAIAAALGDFALEVETNVRLGQIYHTLGDFRRAIEILRLSLAPLGDRRRDERFGLAVILSVLGSNWLVQSLAEVGDFTEGIARGEEGVRLAEEVGQPIDVVVAAQGLGLLHLRQGNLEPAIVVLERAIELCRAWNIRVWFPRVASTLGAGYALAGRQAEALTLLAQAAERHPSLGRMGGHALRVAEGYCWAGESEDAHRFVTRALELSRAHGERGHEAWALRLSGEIASRLDPADVPSAVEYYEQSLAVAAELGMRPLIARCHRSLAELWRRAGEPDAAEQHQRTATMLLRDMGMRLWLDDEAARPSGSG